MVHDEWMYSYSKRERKRVLFKTYLVLRRYIQKRILSSVKTLGGIATAHFKCIRISHTPKCFKNLSVIEQVRRVLPVQQDVQQRPLRLRGARQRGLRVHAMEGENGIQLCLILNAKLIEIGALCINVCIFYAI